MPNTITDPKYLAMKAVNNSLDDMGDGAYLGIMQQHGWETDDLVWFSELQAQDPDYKRHE